MREIIDSGQFRTLAISEALNLHQTRTSREEASMNGKKAKERFCYLNGFVAILHGR